MIAHQHAQHDPQALRELEDTHGPKGCAESCEALRAKIANVEPLYMRRRGVVRQGRVCITLLQAQQCVDYHLYGGWGDGTSVKGTAG